MKTFFKSFGIITIASSLVFGQVATSFAIGDKLGVPEEESIPLVPVGPEFQVNTYTANSQDQAALAMDDDGDFIVVWKNYVQKEGWAGIFSQRYESTGIPLGVEFQVKTGPTGSLGHSDVGMDSAGNFVIVWSCWDSAPCDGIVGQRYDHTGTPQGPEFQINTHTAGGQSGPEIAMSHDGKFVVVWRSTGGQVGSKGDIFGQRYNPDGTPVGIEFQVNSYISDDQKSPSVAINDDGKIVVVWASYDDRDGAGAGIFGQRYNSDGTQDGTEFQVNTYATGHQSAPSVATNDDGNFIVLWNSEEQPTSDGSGVFGQRYDFTGAPIGSEFHVNTNASGASSRAVAMDDNGNAWIAFSQPDQDQKGIFLRGYNPTGDLIGPELQVNTFTTNSQLWPAITLNQSGQATIAWSSWGQDGDNYGIFAQRFIPNRDPNCAAATPLPSRLSSNDHAYHVIDIANVWDPDGDPVTLTVNEIYQDEAVNAAGSGGTYPDGRGIGTNAAEVRDEHVIGGNGRTYRIHFTAEDEWGASCSKAVYVHASPQLKADPDLIMYDSTDWAGIVGE